MLIMILGTSLQAFFPHPLGEHLRQCCTPFGRKSEAKVQFEHTALWQVDTTGYQQRKLIQITTLIVLLPLRDY